MLKVDTASNKRCRCCGIRVANENVCFGWIPLIKSTMTVWDQITDALAATHDAAVQMIDTSVVRVHQHGACIRAIVSSMWGGREVD